MEKFCAVYVMRKSYQETRSLVSRSGCDKLLINLMDSDHGWRDTIVRVFEPLDVALDKDYGRVPVAWNRGPIPKGER